MVTDKMLQQAAGEVELAMLNSLSVQEVEPHQFSPQFERKMKGAESYEDFIHLYSKLQKIVSL